MRSYIVIILLIGLSAHAYAQHSATPLLKKLAQAADTEKVTIYRDLCIYYQQARPDSAAHYVREGYRLAARNGYHRGQALLLLQLGVVNELHDKPDIARRLMDHALELYTHAQDKEGMAGAQSAIGILEGNQGRLKDSLYHFDIALQLYRELKNTSGIIETYVAKGKVYEENGLHAEAIRNYQLAISENHGHRLSALHLQILNNIGIAHIKNGNPQEALRFFSEGMDKSDTSIHAVKHTTFSEGAAKAHEMLGDAQTALDYHRYMLEKAKQYNLIEEQARALMHIGNILKNDNTDSGMYYLQNALGIAKEMHHGELTAEIYRAMSVVYRQQENYKESLRAFEEHRRLLDSLFRIKKEQEEQSYQISYELEESRVRIENLQLVNHERTLERNIGLAVVIAVLILLFVVWYYLRKTNRLNKRLHSTNLVKDKLFSIIAHDLRGPVASMTESLALLEEDILEEKERKDFIAMLHKQSRASSDTLHSLMEWGKTQLQGVDVKPVLFETKNIITKNLEMLRGQAANKSILITDETLASLQVFADPDHFDFVIRNLLSNAIKFSYASGTITISAVLETDKVVFAVADTGAGISEEKQRQFADNAMDVSFGTAGEKGTGLGLVLCKQFIASNKGALWLKSKTGEGATFFFSLPKE